MIVIGVGGKKRAGKSTLAEHIKQAAILRNMAVQEVSWAQPLKDMMRELFRYEVPQSTFVDDSRKTDLVEIVPGISKTVRELYQIIGTDLFREGLHPGFWLARGMAKIKGSCADLVVVPDIRFANELAAIKELGYTIYVEKLTEKSVPIDLHPSEMELDSIVTDFDYYLEMKEGNTEGLKDWAYEFIGNL